MVMKVLILGADGYLGWPTCMYFSQRGHEVLGVDNYFRRLACIELDCQPLFPTPNLNQRATIWEEFGGNKITIKIGDVTNFNFLLDIFKQYKPDTVVHYAEQPSAPYSMISRDKAAFSIQNNLISTLNVLYAMKEVPDCHLIKLGTMGEYGTPNIDIEEGWLEIKHQGRKDKFLYPRQASSLYHTTKIQDTDLIWFYVRTWGIRATDLMQGPVYGLFTEEGGHNVRLMPSFNYDEIFGTVLNRFLVQAVAGVPLTIYGKGNQVRGYINIMDTLQCVYLSATQPANGGELRIFNQITETFSVNELADKVNRVGSEIGYKVKVQNLENPRIEKEDHYYNPKFNGLLEMGLSPHLLTDESLQTMFKMVEQYKDYINHYAIYRGVKWK